MNKVWNKRFIELMTNHLDVVNEIKNRTEKGDSKEDIYAHGPICGIKITRTDVAIIRYALRLSLI